MTEDFSQVEMITGVARRRRFTAEQKMIIVAEAMQPGMSISYVAPRLQALSELGVPMEVADDRRTPRSRARR